MLFEGYSINLKFDFLSLIAIFVHLHSESELVAVMVEIVRDGKGLSKAFCLPTLLGLTVDIQRDHATP